LTEALALEFPSKGGNAKAILPGAIDAPISTDTKENKSLLLAVLQRTPKGRLENQKISPTWRSF
jgi:hypothetical protein